MTRFYRTVRSFLFKKCDYGTLKSKNNKWRQKMNIKEVESYNKKTKTLTLITKIKNKKEKTVETKVYEYPFFVEGDYTQEALGLGNELEENEYQVSLDLFERLTK